MISLRLLVRNTTPQLAVSTQHLHTSKILFNFNPSDSDSSDDEKRKKKVVETNGKNLNEQSAHELNSTLSSMTEQSKTPSRVNVALSPKKPKSEEPGVHTNRSVTRSLFEAQLTGAAKHVAASFGGNTSQTESELLTKILTPNITQLGSINQLLKGMNIDRRESENINSQSHRADRARYAMQNHRAPWNPRMSEQRTDRRHQSDMWENDSRVNLDSGTPLHVFNINAQGSPDPNVPKLATWDILEKRELKMAVTHPPKNYIEQMIQWTEQGRLWRFPIDNEQDLNIDQEEHFSDHVFLEQHLEDWCPTKGPIRHFMELVCVGLSKNPYLSANEKKDHIKWFRDYFASKHDLLKELGAYGTGENSAENKKIEA